jgi:hypothetical protein
MLDKAEPNLHFTVHSPRSYLQIVLDSAGPNLYVVVDDARSTHHRVADNGDKI